MGPYVDRTRSTIHRVANPARQDDVENAGSLAELPSEGTRARAEYGCELHPPLNGSHEHRTLLPAATDAASAGCLTPCCCGSSVAAEPYKYLSSAIVFGASQSVLVWIIGAGLHRHPRRRDARGAVSDHRCWGLVSFVVDDGVPRVSIHVGVDHRCWAPARKWWISRRFGGVCERPMVLAYHQTPVRAQRCPRPLAQHPVFSMDGVVASGSRDLGATSPLAARRPPGARGSAASPIRLSKTRGRPLALTMHGVLPASTTERNGHRAPVTALHHTVRGPSARCDRRSDDFAIPAGVGPRRCVRCPRAPPPGLMFRLEAAEQWGRPDGASGEPRVAPAHAPFVPRHPPRGPVRGCLESE